MADAFDVANYFLNKVDEESGELISNLKLQKLVYFAQGFHLAIYGKPLFKNDIEAWAHGPVVSDLYHCYKKYGYGAIPCLDSSDTPTISEEVAELLDEIYEIYGQFSAWRLRELTHDQPPWKDHYNDKGLGLVIPHEAMRDYFKTQIEG